MPNGPARGGREAPVRSLAATLAIVPPARAPASPRQRAAVPAACQNAVETRDVELYPDLRTLLKQ
jgi:hypothetical protein